ALAVLGPIAVEELGFVAPSWIALGDHVEIVSRAVSFPALGTKIVLVLELLGTVLLPALLVGSERDRRARAERRLAIQAHQLAEFIPREVPTSIR
ncbi:MAG TPA: hypothetical protein VHB21_12075, partial [Minicystis sp.]|nr:hypothetical protein [Minicystis sp.]